MLNLNNQSLFHNFNEIRLEYLLIQFHIYKNSKPTKLVLQDEYSSKHIGKQFIFICNSANFLQVVFKAGIFYSLKT